LTTASLARTLDRMPEPPPDPVRPHPGRSQGSTLRTPKDELPRPRAGAVVRRLLLERLAEPRPGSVISIVAPAGYGKTTLLRQWADREEARVAYVRLDGRDDDPAVLLSDLLTAFAVSEAIDPDLLERLAVRGSSPSLRAFQRLTDAIWATREPMILMLDDTHSITSRPCVDALAWLAERLPDPVRLVAAGRDGGVLPIPRLAASGRSLSIDAADLAFDTGQVLEMARSVGLPLADGDAAELVRRTGGWPVAIYLSLLPQGSGTPLDALRGATSGEAQVTGFMRRELLDPLGQDDRAWLMRSSVLDVMSGPLCDAALETTGSLERLRALERANLLIHRLDDGRSYRYHPLFHDLLRDELRVHRPGAAAEIARRASAWCLVHESVESAVEYARMADDGAVLADVIARSFWAIHWAGLIETMKRWFGWFDSDGVRDRYPAIAVFAGFMHALEGRRHEAELWLAAAERSVTPGPMPDGTADKAPWVAVLRALMAPGGMSRLTADVAIASQGMAPDSPVLPTVRLEAAVERLLVGSFEEARSLAAEAVGVAQARGAVPGLVLGLGLQAWLALREGDARAALDIARTGIARVGMAGLEESVLGAPLFATGARAALAAGSMEEATSHIGTVTRLRPRLTAATPWLSVLVRSETIRACLALSDAASARLILLEVDGILRIRPELGVLTSDAAVLRQQVAGATALGSGHWALTAAELRVLAFLPTHLTFREIAERLVVSPFTVKSQALAVYAKLGVASRRAAIERAVEMGLLEASVLRFPSGMSGSGIG
jgi:LuxR family transcriptional regulator, maltose regulon positive regulatory protein